MSSARVVSIIVRDAHAVVHFHVRFARSRKKRSRLDRPGHHVVVGALERSTVTRTRVARRARHERRRVQRGGIRVERGRRCAGERDARGVEARRARAGDDREV